MNLTTVKWTQQDKTQSRELLGLLICALHCAQLLHTILHRTDLKFSLLPSRQSPLLWRCLFEGRGRNRYGHIQNAAQWKQTNCFVSFWRSADASESVHSKLTEHFLSWLSASWTSLHKNFLDSWNSAGPGCYSGHLTKNTTVFLNANRPELPPRAISMWQCSNVSCSLAAVHFHRRQQISPCSKLTNFRHHLPLHVRVTRVEVSHDGKYRVAVEITNVNRIVGFIHQLYIGTGNRWQCIRKIRCTNFWPRQCITQKYLCHRNNTYRFSQTECMKTGKRATAPFNTSTPNLLRTDNHAGILSPNFYMLDPLPEAQPTVSKQWRQHGSESQFSCHKHV